MNKPRKPVPKFASEAEERAFWESHGNDSTEYVDWSKAKLVSFPKLRPSTETISLRMPEDVLNTIRSHARRLDVPYQSLIKPGARRKLRNLLVAIARPSGEIPRQILTGRVRGTNPLWANSCYSVTR